LPEELKVLEAPWGKGERQRLGKTEGRDKGEKAIVGRMCF
jgi:hypothetical protein